MERSRGESVWAFAERVLAERERSLHIDAALEDDARRWCARAPAAMHERTRCELTRCEPTHSPDIAAASIALALAHASAHTIAIALARASTRTIVIALARASTRTIALALARASTCTIGSPSVSARAAPQARG